MQIMMGVDAEQQAEMEMMIRELEAENKFVISVAEYHRVYALWIVLNSNLIFIIPLAPPINGKGIVLYCCPSGHPAVRCLSSFVRPFVNAYFYVAQYLLA